MENKKYIMQLLKHPNYKNLELHFVVGFIRKLQYTNQNYIEEEYNNIFEFVNNKISNKDSIINKKITKILKTKHVPKDIWEDIWFLKIKDFRDFKSILIILIQIENKISFSNQSKHIKIVKDSNWLTIHNAWRSYLYDLVIITNKVKIKKNSECVIFDIEFDMSSGKEQIIEISALKIRNNKIISHFDKLIKNNHRLSKKFIQITKIHQYQLKYKPSDKVVLNEFFKYIENTDVLIGFAIKHNDIALLKRFDIVKKINKFKLDKYILFDLQEYLATDKTQQKSLVHYANMYNYDIDEINLHRAYYDVWIMYQLFLDLDFREVTLEKTIL